MEACKTLQNQRGQLCARFSIYAWLPFFLEVSHLDATTKRNVCIVLFLFHRMETGSGSLPASPADSGVSDVESSTSSGGNEDANLLLKARLNPNSSLQPSLASHHSHLSSGKRTRISYVQLSYYGVSSSNDLVRPIFFLGLCLDERPRQQADDNRSSRFYGYFARWYFEIVLLNRVSPLKSVIRRDATAIKVGRITRISVNALTTKLLLRLANYKSNRATMFPGNLYQI